VTVIHDALLAAVQAHPEVVVTVLVNGPPAADAFCDVDDRAKLQVPLCVTVSVCPAIVRVPVREPLEVFADTL
jgi:hypothetical protein